MRSKQGAAMIQLKVNGAGQSFDGDPEMPLLWYLRDVLGLTGSKFGCGVGLCGACTVHVSGQATRSCVTTMRDTAGKEVTTVEGLEKNGLHPVQKAWMQINVPQCGYCQVGQMMQAAALLNSNKKPTDKQIDEAMSGNICGSRHIASQRFPRNRPRRHGVDRGQPLGDGHDEPHYTATRCRR